MQNADNRIQRYSQQLTDVQQRAQTVNQLAQATREGIARYQLQPADSIDLKTAGKDIKQQEKSKQVELRALRKRRNVLQWKLRWWGFWHQLAEFIRKLIS